MNRIRNLLFDDQPVRRPRCIRQRINHFEELDDIDFMARYRLCKPAVLMLLQRFQHTLESPYNMPYTIPMVQLLSAIRFYATDSFLLTIGDCVGISKQAMWAILHRVSSLIAALRSEFIHFPSTHDEIRKTQAELFSRAGFPRVLGCVDGKQVKVQSYGGDTAELFRNRKKTFSINVQAICNARLEFLDFVARWPASTHDATIFRNSRVHHSFEAGRFGDSLLVGDSGYPLQSYLMTPIRNPSTAAEQLFNESQIRTRKNR